MSQVETVKKLSHSYFQTGTMNAAKVAKAGGRIHMMRLAGVVLDTQIVPTKFGESVALIGSFRAVSPETGETVTAVKCYLPDVATLPLAAAVKMGQQPQFAIDIYANLDEKVATGFSYTVAELRETSTDPLAAMLAGAQQIAPLKALEAPNAPSAEGVPAPAPEAAPEAAPAPAPAATKRKGR